MKIEILGTGCAKCKMVYEITCNAVAKKGITAEVVKVEDIVAIMEYGVMSTPAVVINGKVVLVGKIPSSDEIIALLD